MKKIYIVYNDKEQISLFKNTILNFEPLVEYINVNTKNGKKEGYKLKEYWGAKKNPFCIVFEGDTPTKAFYSEDECKDNAIIQLIKYLNE